MTSVPLACVPGAIPAEERPAHFELSLRLFDSARETRRLENGYAFVFEPEALMDVARFMESERRCCPFLAFAIDRDENGGPARLRLTGPDGTPAFLESELSLQGAP